MSIFSIIAEALKLVPGLLGGGKQVADAVKPAPRIDPNDATLWHTVHYTPTVAGDSKVNRFCTVCQRFVNHANALCPEAVRRRNAGTG
jgi:hypothetical protein